MTLLDALDRLSSLHTECLTRFHRYKKAIEDDRSPQIIRQIYEGYEHHCHLFGAHMLRLRSVVKESGLDEVEFDLSIVDVKSCIDGGCNDDA